MSYVEDLEKRIELLESKVQTCKEEVLDELIDSLKYLEREYIWHQVIVDKIELLKENLNK
jgi:uncharacterized coiled-coil protein SlyX